MTEGYFLCFDPIKDFTNEMQSINVLFEQIIDPMFASDTLQAVILTATSYHEPSEFYISTTTLNERDSEGVLRRTVEERIPFHSIKSDKIANVVMLIARFLFIFWLAGLLITSWSK